MIEWLLRDLLGVSEARLAVLRQYAPTEIAELWIVRRLRVALFRRMAYVESRDVFDRTLASGGHVERRGDRNVVAFPDRSSGWRVTLRRRSSDFIVFRHVLLLRQYESAVRLLRHCFPSLARPAILDAGANVGLSALYFAHAFPEARILAVEADEENFGICRANLAQLGARAESVHAAVWKHAGPLALGSHRDGRAWSRRVREGADDRPDATTRGVTIDALITERGWPTIDLLKLDVEGAEVALFEDRTGAARWLEATRVIAVETHDPHGHDLVAAELRRAGFFVFERGELMLGARRRDVGDERLLAYFEGEAPPRETPLLF